MRYLQTYESLSADWKYIGPTQRTGTIEYTFNIDREYRVMFSNIDTTSHVSFGVINDNGEVSFRDLEKSNPFKTMKTITEIIKDFIVRYPKISKIKFFGARENKELTKTPEWIVKLLSSSTHLYYLSTYLDALLLAPKQWLSKPTRRTQMFNRWADKEVKSLNWSAKRIGNEIQLVKNK